MAMSLGGTTIAYPAMGPRGFSIEPVSHGTVRQMASGKAHLEVASTSRVRFVLRWEAMTDAELSTLSSKATVYTAQTFIDPYAGSSYTVVVVPGSFRRVPFRAGDGNTRWQVNLTLEETG